jgi:hypothetical protein
MNGPSTQLSAPEGLAHLKLRGGTDSRDYPVWSGVYEL